MRAFLYLIHACGASVLRLSQPELLHERGEKPPVLCFIYAFKGCSDDMGTILLKLRRHIERSLPSELDNDIFCSLFLHYREDIFCSKRGDIEAIGCVVISGDCLRIAVDHHSLSAMLPESA